MTDEAQAQTFDTGATAEGAPIPNPLSLSHPIYGFEAGEEEELLPQIYTACLSNGMIMSFRLFENAVTFASQIANGGVAKVATLGNIVRKEDGATAQAWVPFYVNGDRLAGFSPVVHVASGELGPMPTADAAADPDVV